MTIDLSLHRKPPRVQAAHQRLVAAIPYAPRSVDTWDPDGEFERASADLQRAEDAARCSISFPWMPWYDYIDAMAERGMLSHDPPRPKPDLGSLGYDGPCVIEATQAPGDHARSRRRDLGVPGTTA